MLQTTGDSPGDRPQARSLGLGLVVLTVVVVAVLGWLATRDRADAAPTCTKTWVGPAGGNYSTGANWSPSGRPAATDYACAGPGSSIVYNDATQRTVKGVNFQGSLSISVTDLRIGTSTNSDDSWVHHLTLATSRTGRSHVTVTGSLTILPGGSLGAPPTAPSASKPGITTLASGATFDIATDLLLESDHVFRNEGTVTWTDGQILLCDASVIENTGTFELPADGTDQVLDCDELATFRNLAGGTVVRPPGPGTTLMVPPFENQGTLDVQGGALQLQVVPAGSTGDAGAFVTAAGAVTDLNDDRTLLAGASISGDGELLVSNGTLTLDAPVSATNVRLGFAAVTGDLTITDSLAWENGTLDATDLTIAPGAVATLSTGTHTAQGGSTVTNQGTLTWHTGTTLFCDGSVLDNQGLFEIATTSLQFASGACGTPSGRIVNAATGTVRKAGSASEAALVGFENHGALEVVDGRLTLYAQPATSLGDDGTVDLGAGATLALAGARSFQPTVVAGAGLLSIDGGTVEGDLTVPGSFELRSGALTGAGTLTVSPGGTGVLAGGLLDDGYVLHNQGSLSWTQGSVTVCGGAHLDNAGLFEVVATGGGTLSTSCGAPPGSVSNGPGATVRKTATASTGALDGFENDGAVEVLGGTLVLLDQPAASDGDSGAVTIAPGATLDLGGDRTLLGTLAPGAGSLRVTGGVVEGDVDVTGHVDLVGGTLAGATLTIEPGATGTLLGSGLAGGQVLRNQGTLSWQAGSVGLCDGALLDNQGLFLAAASGSPEISGACGSPAGRFTNAPAGIVRRTTTTTANGIDRFENHGTVEVEAGTLRVGAAPAGAPADAGTYSVATGTTLELAGDRTLGQPVSVPTGTLALTGGTIVGDLDVGLALTWAGATLGAGATLDAAVGATTALTGGGLDGATFTNLGQIDWSAGNVALCAGATLDNHGTLTITGATDVTDCAGPGGVLHNHPGAVLTRTAGATSVVQGTFSNEGLLVVGQGATLDLAGDLVQFTGGTLSGGTFHIAGLLRLGETATGVAVLDADLALEAAGAGLRTASAGDALAPLTQVTASGVLGVSGSASVAPQGDLTNHGSVLLTAPAVLALPTDGATYTQAGGATVLAGASSSLAVTGAGGTVAITGGELRGTGAVTAATVVNQARIEPGTSPGILQVNGDLQLDPAGTLAVELAGTTPGSGHDQVVVSGTVTLGGTLEVDTQFAAGLGDTFTVVSAGSRLGTFDTATGLDLGGGLAHSVGYLATGVELVVQPARIVSVADASLVEGDTGTTTMTFVVSLDAPDTEVITVDWATADGTATAPGDYLAASGTVTFLPGSTSEVIEVQVVGDTVSESDEDFTVVLSAPVGASLGTAVATGTILDDDAVPPGTRVVGIGDTSIWEGDGKPRTMLFPVTLDRPATTEVRVDYRIVAVTATGGKVDIDDKGGATRTLVFKPGGSGLTASTKVIPVKVFGDTEVEGFEFFQVEILSVTGAVAGRSVGGGIIFDDDPGTGLRVAVASVAPVEGDEGKTKLQVRVTLSDASPTPVSVTATVVPGSATPGVDYRSIGPKVITFNPGQVHKTVTITLLPDQLAQGDRDLSVLLSDPVGAVIESDGTGFGYILDDD